MMVCGDGFLPSRRQFGVACSACPASGVEIMVGRDEDSK